MKYALRTYSLSKKYKRHMAVDGASMNIVEGEIYGFVGENGAGKTTMIRLITGLILPDAGSFELFGVKNGEHGITSARRGLGAIVESPSLYRDMSATENLKMQCTVLGIPDPAERISAILKTVGLDESAIGNKRVGNFSLGMRQRLGIAMTLLGDPRMIILDEPMNGLDPVGIVEMRELILRLNRERGITFLISSHILTELSLVATKYGIISKGKLIREITAEELRRECAKHVSLQVDDVSALDALLKEQFAENPREISGDTVKVMGDVDLNRLLPLVLAAGIVLKSVNCTEMSFEEYYLSLLGGKK